MHTIQENLIALGLEGRDLLRVQRLIFEELKTHLIMLTAVIDRNDHQLMETTLRAIIDTSVASTTRLHTVTKDALNELLSTDSINAIDLQHLIEQINQCTEEIANSGLDEIAEEKRSSLNR